MSQDLKITCTGCGALLRVDRGFEGMVIRCSSCGEFLEVAKSRAGDDDIPHPSEIFGRPDSPNADDAVEDNLIVTRNVARGEKGVAYCPKCRRKVGLTDRELADGEAECPACHTEFVLPIHLEAEPTLPGSENTPPRREAAASGRGPAGTVAEKARDPKEASVAGAVRGAKKLLNSIGMTLVFVHPDEFTMGSPRDEEGRRDDELRHAVRVGRGFYLAATPVTQAQWHEVMKTNPSAFKHPNLPVERVSWQQAAAFCDKLTQLERKGWLKAKLHKKEKPRRYRLPTEAEWEYACRAGGPYPFSFGRKITPDLANYDGRKVYAGGEAGKYRGRPNPVIRFKPNAWELVDMHGNVLEWCADWYGPYPEAQGHLIDPTGPANGTARVVRGGSWHTGPEDCRSARRFRAVPDRKQNDLGFRVAMDLKE